MHAKAEIPQAKFAEVFARDREWIEIVLVQVATKFPPALFVFSPEKSNREEEERCNNRCNYVNGDIRAFNHAALSRGRCRSNIRVKTSLQASAQISERDIFH